MIEETIESSGQELGTQSQESDKETSSAETSETGVGAPVEPKTVNVSGREYNLSDIDQALELANDYDRLGREYTRRTQQLAELEKIVQGNKEQPKTDFSDPETVDYLRKLGFVHNEELLKKEKELLDKEADKAMEDMLQELAQSYDGKDGRPKFDRNRVLDFCINRGLSNPEDGYKLMNWDAIKEWELRKVKSAPSAPPSSGGEGGAREPNPKKRVFGQANENEISLRKAMEETFEQNIPTHTA